MGLSKGQCEEWAKVDQMIQLKYVAKIPMSNYALRLASTACLTLTRSLHKFTLCHTWRLNMSGKQRYLGLIASLKICSPTTCFKYQDVGTENDILIKPFNSYTVSKA